MGRRLAARLLEQDASPRIVGIDVQPGPTIDPRVSCRPLGRTQATTEESLSELLREERVDAIAHLALQTPAGADPVAGDLAAGDPASTQALDAGGNAQLLRACAEANVKRLVFASSTMLYGPHPRNPNFLSEASPLRGHPDARAVLDRVQAEERLARFGQEHPEIEISVVRTCWVSGPTFSDRFTRYFDRQVVPVPLGYDPLVQLIHEDDAVRVFERVVLESHPGVYNAVGRGVLPISTLLALAGKRALPLPVRLLHRVAPMDRESGFFDYLRYLFVADGERGWQAFGEPRYSTKEAWMSFISSRRMRRYG